MINIDPIRVISKIRNNRLMEFRESLGMSVKEFAKSAGIGYSQYNSIENLAQYPTQGQIDRLQRATGSDQKELFPEYLKRITRRISVRTIDEPTIIALQDAPSAMQITDGSTPFDDVDRSERRDMVRSALLLLPPRHKAIMEMYMEDMTLAQMGCRFGITKERVRQIVENSLRKLRHPGSNLNQLR